MIRPRINKKVLAGHFSVSAHRYERCAPLQREIAFQLVDWAFGDSAERDKVGTVLDIGCGTGFLSGFLADRLSPSRILALDLAPGMLSVARRNLGGLRSRVSLLLADGEELPLAPCSVDLAASSAAFQWFDSLDRALAGIFLCLRSGGKLVLAAVGKGTYRELRHSFRAAAGTMGIRLAAERYGPPLPGPEDLEEILRHNGFTGLKISQQTKLEFFPSARDFLRSIKDRGTNNPNFRPMSLAVEKTLLRTMMEIYDRSFVVDGQVYATSEVIFIQARRQS